ncbi:MAG: hypothetical protein V1934_00590 [Methanobacteriota archaeon]
MAERKRFERKELVKVLEQTGENVNKETSAYLIGGLNMILDGFKTTTKDVDLVFSDEASVKKFVSASEKAGFTRVKKLETDYRDLNAWIVLETASGMRFDIFCRQVCGGLVLSPGMMARSDERLRFGNLIIKSCSSEDIFLFKSITSRPDDLTDMRALLGRVIDWKIIENEVRSQPDSWRWIGRLYGRLLELRDVYDVKSPLLETLEPDAELSQAMGILLSHIEKEPLSKSEAVSVLEKDGALATASLKKLERLGLVASDKGKYRLAK